MSKEKNADVGETGHRRGLVDGWIGAEVETTEKTN
jgi:hypothetical protein